MTKEKLTEKIDAFLKEQNKSDGGYAEVKKGEIGDLYDIIHTLLELKYERDPNNDLPINVKLINRHTHRPIYSCEIPYDENKSIPILARISSNIATELSNAIMIQEMDKRDKAEQEKLKELLQDRKLDVLTCVTLARQSVEGGYYDRAFCQLKPELDKIRVLNEDLYNLLK